VNNAVIACASDTTVSDLAVLNAFATATRNMKYEATRLLGFDAFRESRDELEVRLFTAGMLSIHTQSLHCLMEKGLRQSRYSKVHPTYGRQLRMDS
jgi:hypothetical protein